MNFAGGFLLLFGGCVVLWLCSLVFEFGRFDRLRTGRDGFGILGCWFY